MLIKNNQGFFQIEELLLPGLHHGFSTVDFGNMSSKFGSQSEVDFRMSKFAQAVGFELKNTAIMELVHGTKIAIANSPGVYKETDALITNTKNQPFMLMTGDCAPIILFDPKRIVVGLAHSGWKGTVGKIASLVAVQMMQNFNSLPEDLLVGFGPTIEKCCYLKDSQTWLQELPEWSNFLTKLEGDKVSIDLNGFTINELKKIGLKDENIYYFNFCTKDHKEDFFSQQAERSNLQKPGRFATVVELT